MKLRRTLLISTLQILGGCGFHPLLAPGTTGRPGTSAMLKTVFVGTMVERFGQLFRTALQTRLDGTGGSVARRYELLAPSAVSVEQAGIQRDTSTTRFRLTATCSWSLVELSPQRSQVAAGSARVLDGYDIVNQQFLSAEFESEDANRRIANGLADQVVEQLATFFDGQSRG